MRISRITNEMLTSLGVYELRELARNLGVNSPTTKKRDELCEEIMKLSSGEALTEQKKSNKGRPPKSVTKIQPLVEDIVPAEILSLQAVRPQQTTNFSNILTLAQSPSVYNEICANQNREVIGYINSINGHFYLKNLKNHDQFKEMIFYIPVDIIQKFALREGDKLMAYGKFADSYNCGIVDEILRINNEDSKLYNTGRANVDISGFMIPTEEDEIFGKEIKKGDRTLSFLPNAEDAIIEIVREIEKTQGKVILVGLELAPEVIFYGQSKQNLELFATTYYNSLEESYNSVINSINYCTSMLKDGKSVKLFIFDIVGMLTRLDLYFSQKDGRQILGHDLESIQLLKKLVGMGKAISNSLSMTTHAVAFVGEENDEIIKAEISKIVKIL